MANLIIDESAVTVSLNAIEKLEALHGDVTVPRSAVKQVRVVPDGVAEVHGIRAPGTSLPGMTMVGVWRDRDGATFAVCHGRRPAIVIDLGGAQFDRIVITVAGSDPVVTPVPQVLITAQDRSEIAFSVDPTTKIPLSDGSWGDDRRYPHGSAVARAGRASGRDHGPTRSEPTPPSGRSERR